MSGGHFYYHQSQIQEIAETTAIEIARALRPKPQKVHEDYWTIDEHNEPYCYHNYCGYREFKTYKDDGEDTMQTRLKEELTEVQQEFDTKDWTCPYEGWNEKNS